MKRGLKLLMKMIMIKANFYCQKRTGKKEPSAVILIKNNLDKDEARVKGEVEIEVEMAGSKAMKTEGSKVSIEINNILNAIIVKNMDIMQPSVLRKKQKKKLI